MQEQAVVKLLYMKLDMEGTRENLSNSHFVQA